MLPNKDDDRHIQFRSGPHTFIAKTIEGHYPNYRNVIPNYSKRPKFIPLNVAGA